MRMVPRLLIRRLILEAPQKPPSLTYVRPSMAGWRPYAIRENEKKREKGKERAPPAGALCTTASQHSNHRNVIVEPPLLGPRLLSLLQRGTSECQCRLETIASVKE